MKCGKNLVFAENTAKTRCYTENSEKIVTDA